MKNKETELNESNISKLKELSEILTLYNLTAVEVFENKKKYRIEKNPIVNLNLMSEDRTSLKFNDKSNVVFKNIVSLEAENEQLDIIVSPVVGIFYDNLVPDAEPLVKVGQQFQKGEILCVIEAMKTFTEIKADQDGIIKEICAKNGDLIEYSQPLFKYAKK